MTRIDAKFAALKEKGQKAFVAYIMGGDPDMETSLEVMKGLPAAGVDVIELGVPFTDPMADGPTIQLAGQRALGAGMTLQKTLDMAAEFRKEDDTTPIVLMGYYNPIYNRGVDKFLVDAKAAGVDGLIVVDLPPEEDDELCIPAQKAGLNFIRLATPTTDDKRLPKVLQNTSGLCVLRVGDRRDRLGRGASGQCWPRGRTHQVSYGYSGDCRVRREHSGKGRGDCQRGRRHCGRLGHRVENRRGRTCRRYSGLREELGRRRAQRLRRG